MYYSYYMLKLLVYQITSMLEKVNECVFCSLA